MATRCFPTGAVALLIVFAGLTVPAVAEDGGLETVYIFRSVEDPDVVPDLSVCDQATFVPNAVLSASLYSVRTRASDGKVVNDEGRRISSGTACARITSLSVGSSVPLIGSFDLGRHHLIGEGACVLTSNTVPAPGLLLAGCTLPLYAGPGVLGGLATSNSVFNPFDVPGFRTGSIWTVRVFDE